MWNYNDESILTLLFSIWLICRYPYDGTFSVRCHSNDTTRNRTLSLVDGYVHVCVYVDRIVSFFLTFYLCMPPFFYFSFPRVLLDRNGLKTVRVVFDSKDKAVEICERIEDGIDGKRHVKHVHLRQQATRRNTANPFRDHFTTSLQEKRSSGRLSLQRWVEWLFRAIVCFNTVGLF